jgi:hypothetical protein
MYFPEWKKQLHAFLRGKKFEKDGAEIDYEPSEKDLKIVELILFLAKMGQMMTLTEARLTNINDSLKGLATQISYLRNDEDPF